MQRAAVIFSGRVKSWEAQRAYLESMKQSIEASSGLPVDFFCSAGCYREDFDAFVAAFDVKASEYKVYEADPKIIDYVRLGPGTRPYNIYSQGFHNKNAHQLMLNYAAEHGYTYKVIVVWRADLICHTPFQVVWPIPPNTIFIPHGDDCGPGINDRCSYGDGDAMGKLLQRIDSFDGFAAEGIPLQAELYLLKHIQLMGLTTQRYNLSTAFNEHRF
jgi:hypothetical protein